MAAPRDRNVPRGRPSASVTANRRPRSIVPMGPAAVRPTQSVGPSGRQETAEEDGLRCVDGAMLMALPLGCGRAAPWRDSHGRRAVRGGGPPREEHQVNDRLLPPPAAGGRRRGGGGG